MSYAVVQMGDDTKGYGVLGCGETRQAALTHAEERTGTGLAPVAVHQAEDGDIVIVNWDIIIGLREAKGVATGPPEDYLIALGE